MTKDELQRGAVAMLGLQGIEVPNLDGFSTITEYLGVERLFDRLSLYVHHKRVAMQMREKGDIPAARQWEGAAESVYRSLPQWARW